ncbi:MAG: DUF1189 domain-containing protein [Candidatus Obscuribacterales bacterium]|nr:DUF1189 domain-containing protein [Candidatus Obscuribacterales bacterium]
MATRKYNFISALWFSFFDAEFYRHVRTSEKGLRFVYFAMLCAMSSIVLSITVYINTVPKLNSPWVQALVSQLPVMQLKNGVLSSEAEGPVAINDPETNATWAVVDTADKFSSPGQVSARILLNSRSIKLKTEHGDRVLEYSQFAKDALVEPSKIPDQLKHWLLLFVLIMTGALFLLDVVGALLKACIIGGVIKLCGSKYNFSTVLRLIFVSWTPNMFVATLLSGANQSNLVVQIAGGVVAIVYLVLGFRWARDPVAPTSSPSSGPPAPPASLAG